MIHLTFLPTLSSAVTSIPVRIKIPKRILSRFNIPSSSIKEPCMTRNQGPISVLFQILLNPNSIKVSSVILCQINTSSNPDYYQFFSYPSEMVSSSVTNYSLLYQFHRRWDLTSQLPRVTVWSDHHWILSLFVLNEIISGLTDQYYIKYLCSVDLRFDIVNFRLQSSLYI